MAKLRKMLGSANSPGIAALMAQMETQSKETLARWSAAFARTHLLPICVQARPEDARPGQLLEQAEAWAAGKCDGSALKPLLTAVRDASRAEPSPAVQAALRAIATAAAVMQTPTNALGMTFYAAAALSYHQLGLSAPAGAYDAQAEALFTQMLEDLRAASIPGETHPARLNWRC